MIEEAGRKPAIRDMSGSEGSEIKMSIQIMKEPKK